MRFSALVVCNNFYFQNYNKKRIKKIQEKIRDISVDEELNLRTHSIHEIVVIPLNQRLFGWDSNQIPF